jgi:hypothetical protein
MTDHKNPLDEETDEVSEKKASEVPLPPKAVKFVPPAFNFNKAATKFNPPNKQRPGHHAGRGR